MESQIDTPVNRSGLRRHQRDLDDTPSTFGCALLEAFLWVVLSPGS